MKALNYEVLRESGYSGYLLREAPEKVMQFGEGNFLRAFVDYWFDKSNELAGWNGKCCLIQPIPSGLTQQICQQEGLYTLYLRGSEKGVPVNDKRVISSVSRCLNPYEKNGYEEMMKLAVSDSLEYIVSNTTEAGIAYDPACQKEEQPPASFPAKLTQVLYRRWQAGKPGVVILSCELIDNNGKELLKCVDAYCRQWALEDAFSRWLHEENLFCSTLVDRIVTGRIRDEKELRELEKAHGYHDGLIDVGECFGVWIIEGPQWLEEKLPFQKAGLNVHVVPDVTPYKKRKVRILNGAHTGFVPGAYLAGFEIVRDCMEDDTLRGFMNKMIYEEIIPTLPLDKKDLTEFAEAVADRFNNPFVDHQLLSIALNSTSKWKARNMPSFLDYQEKAGTLPPCLTASLAAYIAFYSCQIQELNENGLICRRPKGNLYTVSDDRWVLEFYYAHRNDTPQKLVRAVLGNEKMWDQNLNRIPGLTQQVAAHLEAMNRDGVKAVFARCLL